MSMGTSLRSYSRGHTLVSMHDGVANATRYYHFDHQGTTQCLTNEAGVVTNRFASDAWGVEVRRTGNSINRHWYVGNWGYFRDSSLEYVRARFYGAPLGVFVSQDPARLPLHGVAKRHSIGTAVPGRRNSTAKTVTALLRMPPDRRLTWGSIPTYWYTYANGSPALFVDPSGLQVGDIVFGCNLLCEQRRYEAANLTCSQICTLAGADPGIRSAGPTVVCYSYKKCTCVMDRRVIGCSPLGDCIRKHEDQHQPSVTCKPCHGLHLAKFAATDRERIAEECRLRKESIECLKSRNLSGVGIDCRLAINNDIHNQTNWIDLCCDPAKSGRGCEA
jgi:hypothetical protein